MESNEKLFGTDGIRGKANFHPITAENTIKIAKATASYFRKYGNNIIIGKDTRCSGYIFESALISGFLSIGMNVILAGPIPTPAVSMLTKSLRASFGVMISASHNPYYDNGFKFFNHNGIKLSKEDELQIEKILQNNAQTTGKTEFGKAWRLSDACGRYIEFVKQTFPSELTLNGIKIVLDCANGAAYSLAPKVFWELGAEVFVINNIPNGYNINLECGAMHPQKLQESVIENKADIGIALDGDGDRVVICDENSNLIPGDQIIAAIASSLLKSGKLQNSTAVISELCSTPLKKYLQNLEIKVVESIVGDKNIFDKMIENNCNFGAEPCGHIIIKDYLSTSDALIAALQITSLIKIKKSSASSIFNNFKNIEHISRNIKTSPKNNYEKKIGIAKNYIKENLHLKNDEKVIIRKSGTENVIRIMMQSYDKKRAKNIIDKITEIINF